MAPKNMAPGSHAKFAFPKDKHEYFHELMDQLKRFSDFDAAYLKSYDVPSDHCHEIDFSDTSEKGGFGKDEQFSAGTPWQFPTSFADRCDGRVHGMLIGDTFYVIWLDCDHLLYPMGKKAHEY